MLTAEGAGSARGLELMVWDECWGFSYRFAHSAHGDDDLNTLIARCICSEGFRYVRKQTNSSRMVRVWGCSATTTVAKCALSSTQFSSSTPFSSTLLLGHSLRPILLDPVLFNPQEGTPFARNGGEYFDKGALSMRTLGGDGV